MNCRKAQKTDNERIMVMISAAQAYFKKNGINQWQNGYPNLEMVDEDIRRGKTYVLTQEEEMIASAALSFNDEETYDIIYDGQWLSNESYGVIHRVVVSETYKGQAIAGELFGHLEDICKAQGAKSIKVDTHEDNKAMQRVLEKLGYTYCGYILLKTGDKRVAFEKLI